MLQHFSAPDLSVDSIEVTDWMGRDGLRQEAYGQENRLLQPDFFCVMFLSSMFLCAS